VWCSVLYKPGLMLKTNAAVTKLHPFFQVWHDISLTHFLSRFVKVSVVEQAWYVDCNAWKVAIIHMQYYKKYIFHIAYLHLYKTVWWKNVFWFWLWLQTVILISNHFLANDFDFDFKSFCDKWFDFKSFLKWFYPTQLIPINKSTLHYGSRL